MGVQLRQPVIYRLTQLRATFTYLERSCLRSSIVLVALLALRLLTTALVFTAHSHPAGVRMSFFGFDTTLPRDRQQQGASSGGFFNSSQDPFAGYDKNAAREGDTSVVASNFYENVADRLPALTLRTPMMV